MGIEAVIISEALVLLLQGYMLRLRAAGVSAEEIGKLMDEAYNKAKATRPELLPDV